MDDFRVEIIDPIFMPWRPPSSSFGLPIPAPNLSPRQIDDPKELARLARSYTMDCLNKLSYWMQQDENPNASLKAIELLLERGHGKALIKIDADVGISAVNIQVVVVDPKTIVEEENNKKMIDVTPEGETKRGSWLD